MLRNGRSIYGCCHGSCCDVYARNKTLRAREKRAWQKEAAR